MLTSKFWPYIKLSLFAVAMVFLANETIKATDLHQRLFSFLSQSET